MKVRLRLVVDESNRPLLAGDRCSEVAVKAGLSVLLNFKPYFSQSYYLLLSFLELNMSTYMYWKMFNVITLGIR